MYMYQWQYLIETFVDVTNQCNHAINPMSAVILECIRTLLYASFETIHKIACSHEIEIMQN